MIRAEDVILTFLTIVFEHAASGNATFVAFFNSFFPNNRGRYGEIVPITITTSTLALFHNQSSFKLYIPSFDLIVFDFVTFSIFYFKLILSHIDLFIL